MTMAVLKEVYIGMLGFASIFLSLFLFWIVSGHAMNEYKVVGYMAAMIGLLIGIATLYMLVLI